MGQRKSERTSQASRNGSSPRQLVQNDKSADELFSQGRRSRHTSQEESSQEKASEVFRESRGDGDDRPK